MFFRGEGLTKQVWTVWTAGYVEPDDKWMMVKSRPSHKDMVTIIHPQQLWTAGWVEPNDKCIMVTILTIIHLSVAQNNWVGPPQPHQPRRFPSYGLLIFTQFERGGGGSQKSIRRTELVFVYVEFPWWKKIK